MQIFSAIAELRAGIRTLRAHAPDALLGFVPTMGALHAGHASLVQTARQQCGIVVASIFVNPTQFGPNEDFSRYPRTLEADCHVLEAAGVDILFTPTPEIMYPTGASTFVEVEELSSRLDGASRPGHFRGVATVVAKLWNIVQPDRAYFGQKDAAQVAVLRKLVRDLNFSVEMIVCPTVREADGLALSSRNRYLSAEERGQALVLSRALHSAEQIAQAGEVRAKKLHQAMQEIFVTQPEVRVDYIAVIDPDTLLPVDNVRSGALLAVAAFVGSTRLIDNLLLPPA